MDWRFITRRTAMLAAAVGASAALAAPAGALAATASPVFGTGSSFQANAQNMIWLAAGRGYALHAGITPVPRITYTSASSGVGLSEFGDDGLGLQPARDTAAGPLGLLDGFIGTDDPPSIPQLRLSAQAAGANEVTIPITQAPVAVLLSLPANCTVTEGSTISIPNVYLQQAVYGNGTLVSSGGFPADSWGSLLTDAGATITNPAGCTATSTLQVRVGGSGTSYAFKNYMAQINSGNWPSNYLVDDESWPTGTSVTDSVRAFNSSDAGNNGGGALAKHVAAIPGSIGYANLADADSTGNGGFTSRATTTTTSTGISGVPVSPAHQILYAQVQNNGLGLTGETYSDPSSAPATPTTTAGNCTTTTGTVAGWTRAPTDPKASWLGVLASDPNIAADSTVASAYPACAVTYDVVWDNYNAAPLAALYNNAAQGTTAEGTATTVKDYFAYVTSAQGQADVQNGGYNRLPDTIVGKAVAATAQIGFISGGDGGGGGGGGGTIVTPPPTQNPPVTNPPATNPPVVKHDTSATNLKPKLTVSSKAITVALTCPSTKASCTGVVTLRTTVKVKKGKKTVRKTIVIGTGKVTLAAGKTKKLVVKFNKTGVKTLKSTKKLSVKVSVVASDTYGGKKTTTLTATVKQPVVKKKKK